MTNRLETCAREQGIIPGGEKSHRCDHCNYASSSQKNLRTHVFFYQGKSPQNSTERVSVTSAKTFFPLKDWAKIK